MCMKTAVMTDSNSGIFPEKSQKEGIFVVPMPITIDGTTYFEGVDISQKEFLKAQADGREVLSSQPSPAAVTELWKRVLREYEEIVYIPMSSGLSGACGVAKMLSEEFQGKVQVADTHRISVPLRASVQQAWNLIKAGKSASEVKELLEKHAYDASIYIAVDTMEYLKKGGRVTPAGAAIGTLLNIKPVLTIQGGKLDAFAKVRSMKKARKCMIDAAKHDLEKRFGDRSGHEMMIAAAGSFADPKDMEEWEHMVQEAFPGYLFLSDYLPLSITCHVGPDAVGIAVICNNLD